MPYREDIPGFISEADFEVLEMLALSVPENGIIVELGSFMGRSSWTLSQSCHPSAHVYCVDIWQEEALTEEVIEAMSSYQEGRRYNLEQFLENTKDCENITPIKGYTTEIDWPESLKADLIFVDACHESPFVDQDIACWLPRLKPSGILAGHDFFPECFPDVCRAVMNTADQLKLPFQLFPPSSIWCIELNRLQSELKMQGMVPEKDAQEWLKKKLNQFETNPDFNIQKS